MKEEYGMGWILEDNVSLFLRLVAKRIGYCIDEGDQDAVRFGLQDTDEEQDHWYDYPLIGKPPIYLEFARTGGSRLALRWQTQEEIGDKIGALTVILQCYDGQGSTQALETLIARAFAERAYPNGKSLLACDATHLASCPECQEVQATFEGKHWSELVTGSARPPRYYAGMPFLRPTARSFFFPAYLVAAVRDKDREWLDIAREAGISEQNFTVLQTELINFVDYILNA